MTHRYALILTDTYDIRGADEVYGFDDERLADWLREPVVFPDGLSEVKAHIPGIQAVAVISVHSPVGDKVRALSACYTRGNYKCFPHPSLRMLSGTGDLGGAEVFGADIYRLARRLHPSGWR